MQVFVLWEMFFFYSILSFFLTRSVPLSPPRVPWAAFKTVSLGKSKTNLKP